MDGTFNRIKVKHPGYVAIYHLKDSGVSVDSVLRSLGIKESMLPPGSAGEV